MSQTSSNGIGTIIGIILATALIFAVLVGVCSAVFGVVIYALYNWIFLSIVAPVFGIASLKALTFLQSWGIGLCISFVLNILRALFGRSNS